MIIIYYIQYREYIEYYMISYTVQYIHLYNYTV